MRVFDKNGQGSSGAVAASLSATLLQLNCDGPNYLFLNIAAAFESSTTPVERALEVLKLLW